ncbi:MAG: type II secretion system protein N [Halopseudomonas sp.]
MGCMNLQRYLIAGLLWLLAYQAADLSWKFISPSLPLPLALGAAPERSRVSVVDTEIETIIGAKLLGSVQRNLPRPVISNNSPKATKTRHAVKLIGIVHSPIPSHSAAVLLINKQQAVYVPGDSLSLGSNSRLLEVLQDRVVIEVDGQREYIELTTQRSGSGLRSGAVSRKAPLPRSIDLGGAQLEAIVGDYRKKIISDPLSFGRFVQISPQLEGNRIVGYRLNAGKDGRLFKALGLQPGDLVTHINYIDLSKPENLSTLIALVTAGGSVSVGVRRGSEQVDIDVEL